MDENQKEEPIWHRGILRVRTDSGSEDVHYPLFHEDLPEEYKLLAKVKLGETEANKEKSLRRLKEIIKTKENLSVTDDLLITVLRGCKYNLEKSESKLKRFLKSRDSIIKKLCRLDDEKIKLILKDSFLRVLPYRDKHGRAVIVTQPTMRLDSYTMDDVEPIAMSLVLYLLTFPITTVCGISYIAECKCDSILIYFPIVKSFKTAYVRYMFDMPIRYGRADVINENIIIRLFYKALCLFIPKKFTERMFLHGNSYESLHNFYHPDILTKDLEGNMEPIKDDIFIERLMSFIQRLKDEGHKTDFSVT